MKNFDTEKKEKQTKKLYERAKHSPKGEKKETDALYWLKTAGLIIVSAFLVAFGSHCLLAPNNFASGGVTGIAVIFEKAFHIPQSVTLLSVNAPLIIISFFLMNKRFSLLTLGNVGAQTIWLRVMEMTNFPTFVLEEKIFAAILAGISLGLGVALAMKTGGSSGGMDIVAFLVQKKFNASSIAWTLFFLNCFVIASSYFVYKDLATTAGGRILPLVMAACEQFMESKVNDTVTSGMQAAIEFRVVTDKPDEVAALLFSRLERGVTSIEVKGMYTQKTHSMLVCVISKRQVTAFKKLVKEADPDSFAVMSKVSQVLGYGFYTEES